MAFQMVHDLTSVPAYMSRSSTARLARITRFHLSTTLITDYSFTLVTVGGRSIFVAIRYIWNAIPENLRGIASLVSSLI